MMLNQQRAIKFSLTDLKVLHQIQEGNLNKEHQEEAN